MEIYVMDEFFKPSHIVDTYKSFIWTERFRDVGEFEILAQSTRQIKTALPIDSYITLNAWLSYRVMRIETHEDYYEEDGARFIKISGREINYLLEDRTSMAALGGLETTPKRTLTGLPQDIMKTLFNSAFWTPTISAKDKFPFLTGPATTWVSAWAGLPMPTESVTIEFEPTDLLTAMKQVADTYNLDFRITYDSNGSEILGTECRITTGVDRTRNQTENDPVIFSAQLNNLSKPTTLKSNAGYKNVAYVFTQNGSGIVYADGTDESVEKDQRRILTVNASDITLAAGADLNAAIQQRGKQELAKTRQTVMFDGEVIEHSDSSVLYVKYGVGDLVEQHSEEGYVTEMLVTEFIISSDENGDKFYPTLEVNTVSTPGSWSARPSGQVWADVPDTEHWGDLT